MNPLPHLYSLSFGDSDNPPLSVALLRIRSNDDILHLW